MRLNLLAIFYLSLIRAIGIAIIATPRSKTMNFSPILNPVSIHSTLYKYYKILERVKVYEASRIKTGKSPLLNFAGEANNWFIYLPLTNKYVVNFKKR